MLLRLRMLCDKLTWANEQQPSKLKIKLSMKSLKRPTTRMRYGMACFLAVKQSTLCPAHMEDVKQCCDPSVHVYLSVCSVPVAQSGAF